jgi:hypothetical protein
MEKIELGQKTAVTVRPLYQLYKKHPKYTGFLALYVHYLYILGKIGQQQYPPRMTPHLKKEVMQFERYQKQFAFLQENQIATQADMMAFQTRAEETLAKLMKQRTVLNVRKKERKTLYDALADEAALAPVKKLYEDGLSGMETEFAQYMEAVAVLEQCGISKDRLTEEKTEIYGQLAEINRDIRAVRKKLEQYREIKSALPQIKQEIQKIENKEKEVKEYEHRRR